MPSELAVVTGANRGIGFEVCRQLAHRGLRVILTSRDRRAGEAAAARLAAEKLTVEARPLDVADAASVTAFADALDEPVHALVNNAGASLSGFDAEVAARTLATNVFGAAAVTDALLSRLPRGGRVVMVLKQKGSDQRPKTDQLIGADTAEVNGDHGVWSIGNSGFKKGRFYARAPKTSRCQTGKSKTITIGPTLAATTVTIEGENGDYHGTVDSPRLNACANERTIVVYRQKGNGQDPAGDDEIGMDTSELNGDHGEWSIGNSGFKSGNFYAFAPKTSACKAASSDTIER